LLLARIRERVPRSTAPLSFLLSWQWLAPPGVVPRGHHEALPTLPVRAGIPQMRENLPPPRYFSKNLSFHGKPMGDLINVLTEKWTLHSGHEAESKLRECFY